MTIPSVLPSPRVTRAGRPTTYAACAVRPASSSAKYDRAGRLPPFVASNEQLVGSPARPIGGQQLGGKVGIEEREPPPRVHEQRLHAEDASSDDGRIATKSEMNAS